jgi:FKBP-type peptidyl-prolyl cis-trans isomerase
MTSGRTDTMRPRAGALLGLFVLLCSPAIEAQHRIPALPPTSGKPVKTRSGLTYIDMAKGTGVEVEPGRVVRIYYTAWVTRTQYMFDYRDAASGPLAFRLGAGGVLPGLEQGVRGMRVGGKRRLLIPPHLGLGNRGSQRVPPNSALTYDVEVVAVARPEA